MRTDSVEPNFFGYSLQRAGTLVDEAEVGSGDEITDGAGHQHLPALCEGSYSSGDVHCDPANVIALCLHFACMNAASQLQVK